MVSQTFRASGLDSARTGRYTDLVCRMLLGFRGWALGSRCFESFGSGVRALSLLDPECKDFGFGFPGVNIPVSKNIERLVTAYHTTTM